MVEEVNRLREQGYNHHKKIQSLEYSNKEMRSKLDEIQKRWGLCGEFVVESEELLGLCELNLCLCFERLLLSIPLYSQYYRYQVFPCIPLYSQYYR